MFGRLKSATEGVAILSSQTRVFEQPKWSNRSREGFLMTGLTGRLEFGPVESWLVPWLAWAGRLHVGTHRVAGAGGWTVVVE